MSRKNKAERASAPTVTLCSDVLRQVRQHGRSSPKTEVCGVLVGSAGDSGVVVDACIAAENATQGGAHVTFTQDAWEHIYKIKDRDYPDLKLVGWYHSHPGFGVFLSDHDLFIQQNFFSAPTQIAWVYDPYTDAEGCFGWVEGKIQRLRDTRVRDDGTEVAGRDYEIDDGDDDVRTHPAMNGPQTTRWVDVLFMVLSYAAAILLGGVLAMYLLPPKTIVVPVTPEEYEQIMRSHPEALPGPAPGSPSRGGFARDGVEAPSQKTAPEPKPSPGGEHQ